MFKISFPLISFLLSLALKVTQMYILQTGNLGVSFKDTSLTCHNAIWGGGAVFWPPIGFS